MLSSQHRGRAALAVPLIAALSACGGIPDSPPGRVAFPGEGPTAPITETPAAQAPADDALPDLEDGSLFDPVRQALAAGDWMAARLALPRRAPPDAAASAPTAESTAPDSTPDATQLWISYYEARIALLRGDRDGHASRIAALLPQPLPRQLRRELLRHELHVAQVAGNAGREVDLSLRLLRAGGHPEHDLPAIEAGLWSAVQRLSDDEAQALRRRGDEELLGWLDLAAGAALPGSIDAMAALAAWEARYAGHPAADRAAILHEAAQGDAATTQLSLLLPLTGPLASASQAVSDGFLAAFYADPGSALTLDIVDTSRFTSVVDAYTHAQAVGASVIVGPLGKRQVETLLRHDGLNTPVLTLNRPEFTAPATGSALMLSLAPEDEGRQLAERAFAAGARRALVVRPEGSWGERMDEAVRERWTELGGQVPSNAIYGKPTTHSTALSAALGLDASAQRSASVRALFDERIETSGQRRDDLDAVLLLTRNSDDARALKPLLNYHYAGDLPVYAISTADSGSGLSDSNRDLAGLRLLAMPWRLGGRDTLEFAGGDGGSLAALHAMGADAYALARRWWRMHSPVSPTYAGLTASLAPGPSGTLTRRLQLAEYRRGALLPR